MKVPRAEGETVAFATARAFLGPDFRHGMAVSQIHKANLGTLDFSPNAAGYADAITEVADKAVKGDLAIASRLLTAQAVIADQFHHHTGGQKNGQSNGHPMQPEPARLAQEPRCQARTRSGTACRSPAVNGSQRCRMHGGKGSGAPSGNRNAWKLGARSGEIESAGRMIRELARMLDGGES